MNLNLVTSFIIGGLLLIAILAMNMNISHSSTGLTMRQITEQNVQTVSKIMTYDFTKIGYDENATIPDAITVADSNRIVFKSNLNNNVVKQVEWFYDTSTPVTSGTNPNDYLLLRKEGADETELNVGVTGFSFRYYDINRNLLSVPVSSQSERNKIRYIEVRLTISSKEKLGGVKGNTAKYIQSAWDRTFAPKNLNLN